MPVTKRKNRAVGRSGQRFHRNLGAAAALLAAALSVGCETRSLRHAGESGAAAPRPRALRVATSGDYAPFSHAPEKERADGEDRGEAGWAGPDGARSAGLRGFSIEVARHFAREQGYSIEWVRFRWPELLADLAADRFDLALSGVTVRPERSRAGRTSVPVATSGAVLLLAPGALERLAADPAPDSPSGVAISASAFDRAEVRIGVNRGGHLERVARRHFARARIETFARNAEVVEALRASSEGHGGLDAVVTDSLEAPHWQARVPGSRRIGPFTADRKAALFPKDAEELAREFDAWLLAFEASGELEALRARTLGEAHSRPHTARPLPALLAALDERLSHMPAVAHAKQRTGRAIEDLAREERVVAAGLAAMARECHRSIAPSTDAMGSARCDALRPGMAELLRASIEAAKEIQRREFAHPLAASAEAPTLEEIRPALLRLGDHIAWLVTKLPPGLEEPEVESLAGKALARHDLERGTLRAFARAIASISSEAVLPATAPGE